MAPLYAYTVEVNENGKIKDNLLHNCVLQQQLDSYFLTNTHYVVVIFCKNRNKCTLLFVYSIIQNGYLHFKSHATISLTRPFIRYHTTLYKQEGYSPSQGHSFDNKKSSSISKTPHTNGGKRARSYQSEIKMFALNFSCGAEKRAKQRLLLGKSHTTFPAKQYYVGTI